MPHKSGRKSYPAKKGHPGKKMPKESTQRHMMSEAERKKMMKKRGM